MLKMANHRGIGGAPRKRPQSGGSGCANLSERFGYFRGEHPDRAKVRRIIETEPMARWLAEREMRNERRGRTLEAQCR